MKRHLLKTYGYVIDTITTEINSFLGDLEDGRGALMWQAEHHEELDEVVIKNALSTIGLKIQAIGANLAMLDEIHKQTAPKLIEPPKAIIYEVKAEESPKEEAPKKAKKGKSQ